MSLQEGEKAPDFELYDTNKMKVTLKDVLGKKAVLAFFPGAFTSGCTKEMCTFRDQLSEFNRLGGQVYGISVDGPAANKAFTEQYKLNFPVLSDFSRNASRKYGGVHEDFWRVKGYAVAKRSVFVLDETGTVVYSWVTDNPGDQPNFDEIRNALHS